MSTPARDEDLALEIDAGSGPARTIVIPNGVEIAPYRALVSTPVGCAGLGLRESQHAMICGAAAAFANAVCDLLD